MRCHRSALSPWHFSLLALLILLASCQGTQFGTAVEDAVAPTMPPQPERPPEPDSSDPEDGVNPEDRPNLEEELTPNDDNLGNSVPDTSSTEDPNASDPESPIDSTEPSTESPPETDDRPTDEDVSETRGQTRFSDLDVDPQTAEAIAALDSLDVFADIETEDFKPNRSVRRQEFARWTTLANNTLYADEPDRQLPLADDRETPLFLDVPEDSPDFPYIQALANAGIIEIRADREFEPDNLLTRADLIALKVALDLGRDTLQGTLADVERDWEFSDASDIRAGDIPAIASDFTLGEASNIRRIFGTLEEFEPQAPVTRAQVALALTSFGIGDNQRSVIEADDPAPSTPATAPSQSPPPSQSEDGNLSTSTQNSPQSDSPDSTETPDNSTEPDSTVPPADRPVRAAPVPEDSEEGGRFLDL